MTCVLLAEDDPSISKALSIRLTKEGMDVVLARDTETTVVKALEGLETPDLIVMDIGIPGRGGIWAARRINRQQATSPTPVIFLTANRSVEVREAALATSPAAFLEKPCRTAVLIDEIRAAVGSDEPAR